MLKSFGQVSLLLVISCLLTGCATKVYYEHLVDAEDPQARYGEVHGITMGEGDGKETLAFSSVDGWSTRSPIFKYKTTGFSGVELPSHLILAPGKHRLEILYYDGKVTRKGYIEINVEDGKEYQVEPEIVGYDFRFVVSKIE